MQDNQKGEAEKMSAQKRRNTLLAFGGVAIVLAAAVFFLSPNVPYQSEDASGAIGAVRKHRAPQITKSDVVLGDEEFKQEQKVLYADFLSDAEALQNISADLMSDAQSVEARADLAARKIGVRVADIASRSQAAAKSFLGRKAGGEQLEAAEIQDLAARADRFASADDIEQFAMRLRSAEQQLDAKKKLAEAEQALAAFSLDARNAQTLDASSKVDVVRNAVDAEAFAARLHADAEYFEAMAKEARRLQAVERELAVRRSLDARKLGRMSADLLAEAQQLEARAVRNMEDAMGAHAAWIDVLGRMSRYASAARMSLEARKDLDARMVAEARSHLQSIDRELSARRESLEARQTLRAQQQLAAVSQHIESRSSIASRQNLASAMGEAQNLEAMKKNLENLEAKKR
jgi:hypothetical protein